MNVRNLNLSLVIYLLVCFGEIESFSHVAAALAFQVKESLEILQFFVFASK